MGIITWDLNAAKISCKSTLVTSQAQGMILRLTCTVRYATLIYSWSEPEGTHGSGRISRLCIAGSCG
jgi:hypothetical protein